MTKLLLLIVVIGIAVWMVTTRRRPPAAPPPPKAKGPASQAGPPTPMLACAHCGVHLPQSDAVNDAEGRAFCSEAHRLAGPK
jgi:uncharacterized protein